MERVWASVRETDVLRGKENKDYESLSLALSRREQGTTVSLHGAVPPFVLFFPAPSSSLDYPEGVIRDELLRDRNCKAVTTALHVSRGTTRIRVEIVQFSDTAM